MRRVWLALAVVAAVTVGWVAPSGAIGSAGKAPGVAGRVTEFSVSTDLAASFPGIAAGPDGNVWFTEDNAARIGRITPQGKVIEYSDGASTPGNEISIVGITAGPDGNLWFTKNAQKSGGYADGEVTGWIGRITPKGVITDFSNGITQESGSPSYLVGITAGPDGNLWFAEQNSGRIGRITPSGVVTEFPVSAGGCHLGSGCPEDITAGPDGNLWFTEYFGKRIGRITPDGVVTEFPAVGCRSGVTAGSDGNVWATDCTDHVVRINPAGTLKHFSATGPYPITAGCDGNLWFAEQGRTKATAVGIGRISTKGTVTSFPGGITLGPDAMTAAPDGNIWFTEPAGRIGRVSVGVLAKAKGRRGRGLPAACPNSGRLRSVSR